MTRLRRGLILLATVFLYGAIAAPAFAGQPTITRQAVDDTFDDEFLTDTCDVAVETRAIGQQTSRSFTGENGRLIQVSTINLTLTATSEFGTFRFRDIGADVTRVTHEGGAVVQIIGKLPFGFNGTFWFDPITGEEVKSPTGPDLFESTLEAACAALAP